MYVRLFKNILFILGVILSVSKFSYAESDLCQSFFSFPYERSSTVISIQQKQKADTYICGQCDSDAVEVLEYMQNKPHIYKMEKVKILILSSIRVGRNRWPVHVAVYDGNGNIYDPAIQASKDIEPVAVKNYIQMTMNKSRKKTEIRIVDPEDYLRIAIRYPRITLSYFSHGMHGFDARNYVKYEAELEESLNLLPPRFNSKKIIKILREN